MSRQNKVNPDHYKLAGRLSPDDLARERRRQTESQQGPLRGRIRKPMPPWANAREGEGGEKDEGAAANVSSGARAGTPRDLGAHAAASDDAAQQPPGKPRRAASKDASGGRAQKKTARRKVQTGRQPVAKSRAAARGTRRTASKTSRAKTMPQTRKAGRASARTTAARGGRKAGSKKGR